MEVETVPNRFTLSSFLLRLHIPYNCTYTDIVSRSDVLYHPIDSQNQMQSNHDAFPVPLLGPALFAFALPNFAVATESKLRNHSFIASI